jgi:hypothetical protein
LFVVKTIAQRSFLRKGTETSEPEGNEMLEKYVASQSRKPLTIGRTLTTYREGLFVFIYLL